MERINVEIHWCDKNFSCVWGTPEFGSVIVTNKTIDGLKQNFISSLQTQINDMLAAGEYVPEWLASGDYMVEYENKLIITICASSDSFGAFAENCEGIYAAGKTISETKKDVLEAIRLIKENLPQDRWPEVIKGEYTIEWHYDV